MNHFLILVLLSSLPLFLSEHIQYSIRRGTVPMRGVNLGGWLVLEHWMTGDSVIWQGVPDSVSSGGEFTTMQYLGHAQGDPRFEQHRSTWITEQDIIEIANSGLNAVRVPVGYWIAGFDNHDPSNKQEWKVFAPGGLKYLDNLVKNWANTHNVAVLVGLHAGKGSQNGNDNSAPTDPGHTYWGSYEENIDNLVDVAWFLANRYKDDPAFLGIGMLNEPAGTTSNNVLTDYYTKDYNTIRSQPNDCILVHSPLLWEQGPGGSVWPGFFSPPTYSNVWHEWHKYLIWGYEGWDENRLLGEGLDGISSQISQWQGNWLFIGEFTVASSAAFNDQGQFLSFVNKYFSVLKGAHSGWTYWTWKTSGDENGGRTPWSLRNLIRRGDVTRANFA